MAKKGLLKKSLEEIKADLDSRVIDVFDCMAEALEEFDNKIIQGCRIGHAPIRDAQSKINGLFDYLSRPENPIKLPEKDENYFRIMYNRILETYNLILDEQGIVRGAKVGRFIQETASVYSKEILKDPFRSYRIR